MNVKLTLKFNARLTSQVAKSWHCHPWWVIGLFHSLQGEVGTEEAQATGREEVGGTSSWSTLSHCFLEA